MAHYIENSKWLCWQQIFFVTLSHANTAAVWIREDLNLRTSCWKLSFQGFGCSYSSGFIWKNFPASGCIIGLVYSKTSMYSLFLKHKVTTNLNNILCLFLYTHLHYSRYTKLILTAFWCSWTPSNQNKMNKFKNLSRKILWSCVVK